jgi:hypothetical protein
LSVAAARRQLRRSIAAAAEGRSEAAVRDLVIGPRDYLHAELPELNPGDTPRDIRRHVETALPSGPRRDALLVLATQLADGQRRLEHGTTAPPGDRTGDVVALEASLDSLRGHLQVWRRITEVFKR